VKHRLTIYPVREHNFPKSKPSATTLCGFQDWDTLTKIESIYGKMPFDTNDSLLRKPAVCSVISCCNLKTKINKMGNVHIT